MMHVQDEDEDEQSIDGELKDEKDANENEENEKNDDGGDVDDVGINTFCPRCIHKIVSSCLNQCYPK